MKKILFLLFIIVLSCDDSKVYIADSSGILNMVNIISENTLWENELGEKVRFALAKEAEGLPQPEPLYKLKHIPTKAFTGFAKKNRTFIQFSLGQKNKFSITQDTFAKPQTGIFLEGRSEKDLISLFEQNKEKIKKTINKTEIRENLRRMNKSLKDDQVITDNLGIELKFPSAYRYASKEKDNFIWLRKEIKKGSMELFVYEVPIERIENTNSVVTNIVKIRDSIGKKHVPGPRKGTYMITEEVYMPYLKEVEINGRQAYETRGTWEVKGAFMAGPFINYAIKDKANNRYLIIEGVVFKPSAEKRNNIFEIEAIVNSVQFIK